MKYSLVVGLETHVELATKSKIFCSCTTKFGAEPNTHCCPVCLGMPGSLPVFNRKVAEFAVLAGFATNCEINLVSKMDRKNYVYPDLPKAYQISQFDQPICVNGYIMLSNGRKIRINHIHMEEDAGKLVHENGATFVDYNRGGVPLIEIVTEPDFRSSGEVQEYITKLQKIMRYIGISDCKMQEGSMRCDVNISVKEENSERFGVRTEIKNMNSISFIVKAIDFEKERQIEILQNGGKVFQETRRYDEKTGETFAMRNKENANDYRYFNDPDLLNICLTNDEVKSLKESLPELPDSRVSRYVNNFKILPQDADLLTKYRNVSDFFEKSISNITNAKIVSNLILGKIFGTFDNESEKEKFAIKITPEKLNELAILLDTKKLNFGTAKKILDNMLETGKSCFEFLSKSDIEGFSQDELQKLCENAVIECKTAVKDYLSGKEKALKSIIGNVMKNSRGRANSQEAEKLILELINNGK